MHGDSFAMKRFRRGTAPLSQLHEPAELAPQIDAFDRSFDGAIEIPFPTEVPQPPNLSRLPSEVLHSGTVETLIAHNEDLIARLKVNLRRNATLEQNILGLEKQLAEMRQLSATLEDQVYVIRERDRLNREKTNSSEDRVTALEQQLDFARVQANEAIEQAEFDRQRLITFNRRINRWVKPGFKRAMQKMNRDNLQAREFLHHTDLLRRDLAQRDIEVAELTKQVNELRSFQRERERNFQKDQAQLAEAFENQLSKARKEIQETSMQLSFFRDRAGLLDETTRRSAEIENRAIALERRAEALESKHAQVKDEAAEQRREAQRLSGQVEILRDEMRRSREENEQLESENGRMKEQLSSLQILWAQSRKEAESMQLRLEALTQINQELSRNLNQARTNQEIESLELKNTESSSSTTNEKTFAKIDSLLSTLECGLPASRPARKGKLEHLEFIETSEKKRREPGAEL